MKFKLRLRLDVAILFRRKCTSHICDGKNTTKLAQIVVSLIQGREHKRKWTSFYLLPDLCPLCFSCCHVKQQTSVGSLCLTQIELSRTYSTTMLLIVDQDLLNHHAVDYWPGPTQPPCCWLLTRTYSSTMLLTCLCSQTPVERLAVSTFSPVGLLSSNGLRTCVCLCPIALA